MRAYLLILLAGCAAGDPDDAAALEAPAELAGKADGATVTGLFAAETTSLRAGDIPNLELRADGSYVRARCYHAGCIAETDRFDTYTSTSGHRYLRLWSFTLDADRNPTPVIADVYELRTTSTGIKLRKAYSTRWLALTSAHADALCAATSGAWSGACACPGGGNGATEHPGFVAGAGGCITIPGGGEDACDASGGLYTDDDATPIGTYCECGVGRHVAGAGSCVND